MKKKLVYILCVLSCSLVLLSACKKDKEPEVPPTVEDIIAEYAGDKLKSTIEGADVDVAKVKVELTQSTNSDKVNIILYNVVPDVAAFRVSDAQFAATTRSAYISTLKGETSDDVAGYTVKVDGTVDNQVLTVKIVLTGVKAENTNTKPLVGLVYKGNMGVSNVAGPVEQRVYVAKARSASMAQRDTSMVRLTIKNFNFNELGLGNIVVDTILVQKRGEVLAFKTTDRQIKVAEPIGEVRVNLKGTIVGEKMNLTLGITVSGQSITSNFEGVPVVENMKAEISNMTLTGNAIVEQKSGGGELTLRVWDDTPDAQLFMVAKYTLSEGAKVDSAVMKGITENKKLTAEQIAGNQPIDFSLLKSGADSYLQYFVSAEDTNVKGTFSVFVDRMAAGALVYDMKTWVVDPSNGKLGPNKMTTNNMLANFLPLYGIHSPTQVVRATDGSAEITTSRTVSETSPNTLIPGVTAGQLFLGTYAFDISNILKSTKYGIPYRNKPESFTFTYKYTPGTPYYKTVVKNVSDINMGAIWAHDTEVALGMIDSCSIATYLYEVTSYDETLDGTNITTSKKVILKAVLDEGSAKNDYTTKTIPFQETGNGEFDAAKKYKLAIICSSSIRNNLFMGGDGSKLWVKSLEVK